MERGELLGRLDSLSKDARAAGYILLITDVPALSTLASSSLEGKIAEQQQAVGAAAARQLGEASAEVARAREEESEARQKAMEEEIRAAAALREV
jgi:hypothetical protein